MKKIVLICILMLILTASLAVANDYPERTALLNDYVALMPEHSQQYLENILVDFEAKTSHRILVGIMATLPAGITLEDYAEELFARWQPREAERRNSVLLVIFMQDRKLRLEVGKDLQPLLTDEICQSIVTDTIAHEFKLDNDFGAVMRGLDRIILTIKPDHQFPEPQIPAWYAFLQKHEPNIILACIALMIIIFFRIVIKMATTTGGHSRNRGRKDNAWNRRNDNWNRRDQWKRNESNSRSSSSGSSSHSHDSNHSGDSSGSSKGGGASGSW